MEAEQTATTVGGETGSTSPRAETTGPATTATSVRVRNLKKTFVREDGEEVNAVDDVSFDVAAGEFVVLLGPSGCGKTTLLRCIAGLEYPDAGSIEILGREDFNSDQGIEVPPEKRRLSMVFQTYALWPHFSVFNNVAYPLTTVRSRKPPKAEIRERVHEALRLVGIPNLAEQYPHKLSGGQRQRVALARALVVGSELILFDEPLSNVDAKVRSRLRIDLLDMQQKLGFAALFVTHDQDEAMQLADRIAVMDTGRIAQLAPPTEVYSRPASRYVADFIGSRNEVLGRVVGLDGGRATVSTPIGPIEGNVVASALSVGDGAAVVWRPESTKPSTRDASDHNSWPVAMRHTMFMGSHVELVADSAGHSILAWVGSGDVGDADSIRSMSVRPDDVRIFAANAGEPSPDALSTDQA